jgi:hypothetical protein
MTEELLLMRLQQHFATYLIASIAYSMRLFHIFDSPSQPDKSPKFSTVLLLWGPL